LLKAIALDFDGVILESVDLKTRAFRALFRDHPQHLDRIVKLHLENGGLSRHEKFAIIYRDYLKQPLSEPEKARLGREFSRLIEREILTCPYVPGALEFLKQASEQLPLFLVSGTPEPELREIVRQRQLESYFRNVCGSPRPKDVLLSAILAENGWRPSEVVFVGDSMTDFRAAQSVGMPFIGRVPPGAANPFPDSVKRVVADLKELAACSPLMVT
jgi:HAD superfamily hydrolase (TIGR01549 family)